MDRRRWLCCNGALAAGLFSGLLPTVAVAEAGPDGGAGLKGQTWRSELPAAARDLVLAALQGLDAMRLVDTHAHLLGTGDAGSGCSVHPHMQQWWHPLEMLRRRVILGAARVSADAPSVDRAYVQRLLDQAAGFPAGARWWLFAFEQAHDDHGRPQPGLSSFHVPDAYAAQVAAAHPGRFDWVASIHPYREDALTALEAALAAGAVAVKWLPSAMNIDLREVRCRPFYDRLARSKLPLIVHCGEEKAAPGAGRDELGNPLLVRQALAHGVRVIVAHCASLGHAADTDRASAPRRPAFELFARLMDEPGNESLLLGDISAVFQRNRSTEVWRAVLQRDAWHARLLHGSDHPLPGVGPLFSLSKLQHDGLLDASDVQALERLRDHNPLLFDLVLKRRLRLGRAHLPASVFEASALRRAAATVAAA
jgi:mannonate dehydratase